ncbi:Homoserine dehydrogenase [Candidatus Calditenuaceae archaeon HR02]|nr:Homoserine dehydrogenase [Candidatus Calditenuaceae archaeon HR02]
MIRCGIVGYGFLGKRLASYLTRYKARGLALTILANSKGYLYSPTGFDSDSLPADIISHSGFRASNPVEVIGRGLVDLLVVLTPTNVYSGEPGLTYVREALKSGVDVVTADKGPLVVAFKELTSLAGSMGVSLCYEATVGGGIPIFSLARHSLRGDRILSIKGILNGTTNYILSRMHFEGLPLDLALQEAQMMGLAERDPSLDLEGIDSACKVVILANALLDLNKRLEDVKVKGITQVTSDAILAAKELGMTIKLVGSIEGGKLSVAPRLVRLNHPLCVHGSLNAIQFKLEILGDLTLIGRGAGESTLSALLSDIEWILAQKEASKGGR